MIKFPDNLFFENGARAVILLHSFTGTPNDHRILGRFLERAGYTVYVPILTNHCSTQMERLLDTPIEDWHQDGIRAVQYLREQGYTNIAIMGLSLGGLIAIRVLTEMPSLVGGGCFCSPIVEHRMSESQVPYNFLKYANYVWEQVGLSKEEIALRDMAMRSTLNEKLAPFDDFAKETQNRLSHIHRPLFIADAGKDEMVRRDTGRLLYEEMHHIHPTLPLTYKHYPLSKHVITVSRERKQLQDDVLAFLNTLDWKE